jgi:hypothetical protein
MAPRSLPPTLTLPRNFAAFPANNSDNSLEINIALSLLGDIQNRPADTAYLKKQGINIIFNNGKEALDVIQNKNIQVVFGDMGDSLAHAQWIADQNVIMVNQKYKGDFSKASLYAISEAVYHEAGHAAMSGDAQSSIQEELDCLALNTLGYRYHTTIDPSFATTANTSRLIQDGVALYNRLFFPENDPNLTGLQARVKEKYGMLPAESPDHSIPMLNGQVPIADRVCRHIQTQNSFNTVA